MLVDRRAALLSSLLYLNPVNHSPITLSETVQWIVGNCPETFRMAVRDAGDSFLYRGEPRVPRYGVTLLHPDPDLLQPDTYAGTPDALTFFQCLEQQVDAQGPGLVRPSVGHIGTTAADRAAPWGPPVSIWPLCQELSFLWPDGDANQPRLFFPNPHNDCRLERFVANVGLEKALAGENTEIMVARRDATVAAGVSPCCFLACSVEHDLQLKRLLVACDYGL